jgi:DNA-binding transcriptional MerR regulator
VPARNASGHRLFTRRQVEQLKLVRAQMREGAGVADAYRVLAERIDTGSRCSALIVNMCRSWPIRRP